MDRGRRATRSGDPLRPRYHFVAPQGRAFPFDPNGCIFWNGRFHLFYIFQRDDLPEEGHCWGHASSTDLMRWTIHPAALVPRRGEPDVGIFSGCALVGPGGVPTLVYHGVNAGTCIAVATDDDLIGWSKSPHNPVIPEPLKSGDPGFGVYNVFDPHVWADGDRYLAILGGRVKPRDERDTAYLFESRDLINWRYLHPFYEPRPEWTDVKDDCACPDFFELRGRHVLLCISHRTGARYYLGDDGGDRFVPREHHHMNFPGGGVFAPETMLDDRGRRIMFAWVIEGRTRAAQDRAGWSGVMTLPRVLDFDAVGRLTIEPATEVETLRGPRQRIAPFQVPAGDALRIDEVPGDGLELQVEARVAAGGRFGLDVRCTEDGAERTRIIHDDRAGTLSIDAARSSLCGDVVRAYPEPFREAEDAARGVRDVPVQTAPFDRDGEPLSLRIFLDGSILEVYANGRQCLTQRIYPTRPDALGIRVFSDGEPAHVTRFDVWLMADVP